MRELLVTDLVKQILGPRDGIHETMQHSPLSEYVTGVLAPRRAEAAPPAERNIDNEAEIPRAEGGAFDDYEEDALDSDILSPPLLSPALEPTRRPPSIGISFEIAAISDTDPQLDVCLTWSRYFPQQENSSQGQGSHGWVRAPRSFTTTLNATQAATIFIEWASGRARTTTIVENAEISLYLIPVAREGGIWHVTLVMANQIQFSPTRERDTPRTEHHVFQPQIRIKRGINTRLIPNKSRLESYSDEESELSFLYQNRPSMAQGHLCAAVWDEIDCERRYTGTIEFETCRGEIPFHWADGDQPSMSPEDRTKFSRADLRTEFVPLYSIVAPNYDWPRDSDLAPELHATALAETWNPADLRTRLEPLTLAYGQWIQQLNQTITHMTSSEGEIARRLIRRCSEVLDGIRRGIDLLCADENARLAFCFSNACLDLQSQWSVRHRPFIYRPFQLAFFLLTLESIVYPDREDRRVCDLLWVPTGVGKTEAYLAIAVFTMAYRRRRCLSRTQPDRTGAGVAVISRYTLRLLTIQQFRRTLVTVTAADYLRVQGLSRNSLGSVGWRPRQYQSSDQFLWGTTPFTIGLWVGQAVTPNRLSDMWVGRDNNRRCIPGALTILAQGGGESEPSQVLNCPACGADGHDGILAIPPMGLAPDTYTIHFVLCPVNSATFSQSLNSIVADYGDISVSNPRLTAHSSANYCTLTFEIQSPRRIRPAAIASMWRTMRQRLGEPQLLSCNESRPGYFFRTYLNMHGRAEPYDFDIFCPNPNCPLHIPWCSGAPTGMVNDRRPEMVRAVPWADGNLPTDLPRQFQNGSQHISDRMPIPALTVDDQIYHEIPTMIVATVDKFARPAFEPAAAALFGNVEYHHCVAGYYRQSHVQHHLRSGNSDHPKFAGTTARPNSMHVATLDRPDLILQDELHLIEGPLGSLTGIYESAIEFLTQENAHPVKYVASTATVRRAAEQVAAVFARTLRIFPPPGITVSDRFFLREPLDAPHPLKEECAGRLYLGVCAPGLGPLIPIRNIWAQLLSTANNNRTRATIDSYWTLTGYFNAMRELGGIRALYRQDIQERMDFLFGANSRRIHDDNCQELSSRSSSTDLPSILDILNSAYPNAPDSLFTTSMFGTGVDIPRLGLMVVHGQPKTTSAYIQSTGRVGRNRGALVVTFYRASRPRDLNHYEFFHSYHSRLHQHVEPISAFPFAPGSVDRAGGPVMVLALRNMSGKTYPWDLNDQARLMAHHRSDAPENDAILRAIVERAGHDRSAVSYGIDRVRDALERKLDLWRGVAVLPDPATLLYVEYTSTNSPVVLGDPPHQRAGRRVVYANAPQSLRDIEETTAFEV